jgi:hypothetical protein
LNWQARTASCEVGQDKYSEAIAERDVGVENRINTTIKQAVHGCQHGVYLILINRAFNHLDVIDLVAP